MSSGTRIRLLILLLAPALAVPRGVALSWCLCVDQLATCCPMSCCEAEDSEGVTIGEPTGDACGHCHSVQVEDFEQIVSTSWAPADVPTFAFALPGPEAPVPARVGATLGSSRAPPLRVTRAALRRGSAPLRL